MLAEKEVPPAKYYGKFEQIEDGVGSLRLLKDDFEKRFKKAPKKLKKPLRLTFGASKSVYNTLKDFEKKLVQIENLTVEIVKIEPHFYGKDISVAGLICYQDLVIPSVMLSPYTNKFLDGKHLEDLKEALNCNVHVIKDIYSVKEIFDLIK